jgi:hypothetical protein
LVVSFSNMISSFSSFTLRRASSTAHLHYQW